jgi:hypothetical protein
LLLLIASCSAPKKAADQTSAEASPVGNWKISKLEVVHTPQMVAPDALAAFTRIMLEVGEMKLKVDSTYKMTTIDGAESGNWRLDEGAKTIYFDKAKGATDRLRFTELTWHYLKGTFYIDNGASIDIELTRVQ